MYTQVNGASTVSTVRMLLYRVFGWMAFAVGISGATAAFIASRPELIEGLFQHSWSFILLMIAQLILVVALSRSITTLSYPVAQLLFILYSLLTGVTMSVIFVAYTTASIVQVFFSAAGMFAVMALYGIFTQTDLSSYGSLLRMTLFGIIIAMVVNMFLASSTLDYIVSVIGVFLFSALTAYDIQNIQRIAAYFVTQNESFQKIALLCALQLYLDFINLFLSLLRLFGRRQQ